MVTDLDKLGNHTTAIEYFDKAKAINSTAGASVTGRKFHNMVNEILLKAALQYVQSNDLANGLDKLKS
ncbi:MAG: hypothetical protein WAK17_22250 [Candidatus Nitrosopolaris sp.]|jgi:hypothetical protein